MSHTAKKTSRPARRNNRRRWVTAAAACIATTMVAAGALAAVASIPQRPATAPAAAAAPSVPMATPPAPTIGQPFLADLGNGVIANITIHSAAFTAPAVLTLDIGWEAWVGTGRADTGYLQVLDGTGKRATARTPAAGSLENRLVTAGTPARGTVTYEIAAGPAVLVIKPASAKEATRITVSR